MRHFIIEGELKNMLVKKTFHFLESFFSPYRKLKTKNSTLFKILENSIESFSCNIKTSEVTLTDNSFVG